MKQFRTLIFSVLLTVLAGTVTESAAQILRVGAGLDFSTGADFNSNQSGNPGFKAKTWISLDKRSSFHIVPSVSAYNRNTLGEGALAIKNYMIQGDLNGQYDVYADNTLKTIVFAGGNFTYMMSTVHIDPKYVDYYPNAPENQTDYAFGGNIGAGLELRMGPRWDMNVSAKYLFSKYSQFILSVEGVYYFKSRRRSYRRR